MKVLFCNDEFRSDFFYNLCGASICGTNRILFYSLGKLVHRNSTRDSKLVFVDSTWKELVEKAIGVIFVMIKNRRKSRYLDFAPISLIVRCQMDKKFLHFDTLRVNLNINTKCSFCFFVMLIIVYKRNQ
jgi:hypothetical protein